MSTDIGTAVRTLRLAADVSQTGLARALVERGLTITQQAVDRIERGLRSLRVEEAAHIAAVLDVPAGDLVQVTPARLAALEQIVRARGARSRLLAEVEALAARQAELQQELAHAELLEREGRHELETLAGTAAEPLLPGLSSAA